MGISIVDFRCRAAIEPGGAEEPNETHSIVFVRRGLFQRIYRREKVYADPNHVLFFNANQPYRYSHPVSGGDDCTILTVASASAQDLVARHSPRDAENPEKPFRIGHGLSSRRSSRLHYELLSLLREPIHQLDTEDALVALAQEAVRTSYAFDLQPTPKRIAQSRTQRQHYELVEETKLAVNQNIGSLPTLRGLAIMFGCSPFHLSRTFRSVTGVSLRHYVGRLRANLAAERIRRGSVDFTDLALELGFFDHSHFSNAFKRAWGLSPSEARARFRS